VAERLGFDGALLLHRVQVDPLPQLVPHGEGVAREAGQAKVGPFGRAENLKRGRIGMGSVNAFPAGDLVSARRCDGTAVCYLFKVARDGEGLVPQSEVARDGDAVLADHCDARTLYMDHAAA
jgi:hypothetical protein